MKKLLCMIGAAVLAAFSATASSICGQSYSISWGGPYGEELDPPFGYGDEPGCHMLFTDLETIEYCTDGKVSDTLSGPTFNTTCEVYRDDVLVATTKTDGMWNWFTDYDVTPGRTYTYEIKAKGHTTGKRECMCYWTCRAELGESEVSFDEKEGERNVRVAIYKQTATGDSLIGRYEAYFGATANADWIECCRTDDTRYCCIRVEENNTGSPREGVVTVEFAGYKWPIKVKQAAKAPSTYTVRLHRNNSERDGATAGRTYTIGKARALPRIQNELKWAPRKGYDFLGWAKSATATTAQYTDGQSLKDLTTTKGATVHLYAVWKAHKYIVRLHRNNSKNDGATTGRAFDYDQVRFLPTMAELKWGRMGYMFMGWSQSQSSSTVKYADGLNVYNLSQFDGEELHIWGVWKVTPPGAYLLRLHRNNSERDGATAGMQLKLNRDRKLPTARELGWTRSDAKFKGWATTARNAASGRVAYADGATVRNLVSTPGATCHLYAVWE